MYNFNGLEYVVYLRACKLLAICTDYKFDEHVTLMCVYVCR